MRGHTQLGRSPYSATKTSAAKKQINENILKKNYKDPEAPCVPFLPSLTDDHQPDLVIITFSLFACLSLHS